MDRHSVSILGRLSTLRSVHYQRFHCSTKVHVKINEVTRQTTLCSCKISVAKLCMYP